MTLEQDYLIDNKYLAFLSAELKNIGKVVWTKDKDTWILKLSIGNIEYTFYFLYDNFSYLTGNVLLSSVFKDVKCDFVVLATKDVNLNFWVCSKDRLTEFVARVSPKTIKKEMVEKKWLTSYVYDRQKLLSDVFVSYSEWSSSLIKMLKLGKK